MRGLYISQDLSHAPGIHSKIQKQIQEFERAGYEMDTVINKKRTKWDLFRNVVPFFSVQFFHTGDIDWQKYAFVYIRKGAIFDRHMLNMLKKAKIKNAALKVLLELPTYPYMEEFKGWLYYDVALKEKYVVPKLKNYVDRIVTYSDDESIFDIPCIHISNAYDFDKQLSLNADDDGSIVFLGVAALTFYHGYDRLIDGIGNYYKTKKSSQPIVKACIIGDGPVLADYKRRIKEQNIEDYMYLAGRKPMEELPGYFSKANIGVDSLGRHRSGVTYNSSLKGKEYMAYGLPSISGVKTELDGTGFPYYKKVPATDEPIDIASVVTWYQELVSKETRNQMAETIQMYGKKHFTFSETFKPVIGFCKGE